MGVNYSLITQEEIIQILREYVDDDQRDEIDYLQILNSAIIRKNEYIIQLPNNKKVKINKLTGESSLIEKNNEDVI